jgi:KDO2-lipid IV(A) lauroyltransferase
MRGADQQPIPLAGKLFYYVFPFRRAVIGANLRRAFGSSLDKAEVRRLTQAHYAHLWRSFIELVTFTVQSPARRQAQVRIENAEACIRAHAGGKGVLILTGHFGNWELATVAGIGQFPEYRGQFHVLRRPLWPGWLDQLATRRFRRAGLGVLPKKGALDQLLDRLAAGDAVVFILDQHAGGRDGIRVDFFGHPAGTFRSLAIIALATRAPVVPVATWRQPDGRHVLRFEEPLTTLRGADANESIRANTRAYNAALERLVMRHPEQWFWVHRRWKEEGS